MAVNVVGHQIAPNAAVAQTVDSILALVDTKEARKLRDWMDRYGPALSTDSTRRKTCRKFAEKHGLQVPAPCLDSNASAAPSGGGGRVVSTTYISSFRDCDAQIWSASVKLGTSPVVIVNTGILKIVRFVTNDGSGESVLVTCSLPDKKMVITLSQ